ncbi:MAG: CDP-alcohol phosphatidyltransferase family protein [Bacteroidetes bacterium]|jgi:CDP-diacylglycerol--glycerol-3-phosphate 3-phosphatidyltransferase|nr:CDP-alcohol phosphatidyltransferase family protein [Bacteroidota bacterium]MDF1864228.1 CDP-alcohol phosphatidyltransferase family protein [Saprospiraceae bacterium]
MLKKYGQPLVYKVIDPLIDSLVRNKVHPNAITTIGLVINFLAAIVFVIGAEFGERNDHSYVGWAGAIILFAGLFDMIDGQLARKGNLASKFGALYDSVLDRYSEMIMFLGICYYLVSHDYFLSSLFAFIAMIGSVMVSYTRARAEGLGVDASVGLMQRPERIVIIGLTAIACGLFSNIVGGDIKVNVDWMPIPIFETISIFTFPLAILAVMANITAIKRLNHSKKVLEEKE